MSDTWAPRRRCAQDGLAPFRLRLAALRCIAGLPACKRRPEQSPANWRRPPDWKSDWEIGATTWRPMAQGPNSTDFITGLYSLLFLQAVSHNSSVNGTVSNTLALLGVAFPADDSGRGLTLIIAIYRGQ